MWYHNIYITRVPEGWPRDKRVKVLFDSVLSVIKIHSAKEVDNGYFISFLKN